MVQCPNPKLRDSWALWCLAQDAWLKAQEWITGVSSWVSGKNVTCHFFHGNISLWRGQAPHEAGSPRGSWAKKLLDVGEHLVFFIMSCWMVQKSGRYEVNITIIYRVSYIQTVVVWDLNHQQYVHQQSGFTNFWCFKQGPSHFTKSGLYWGRSPRLANWQYSQAWSLILGKNDELKGTRLVTNIQQNCLYLLQFDWFYQTSIYIHQY